MYYNRRTIHKTKKTKLSAESPFNSKGYLKKGYRYIKGGKVINKKGDEFLISDYK